MRNLSSTSSKPIVRDIQVLCPGLCEAWDNYELKNIVFITTPIFSSETLPEKSSGKIMMLNYNQAKKDSLAKFIKDQRL
jgi:hypothetical protein